MGENAHRQAFVKTAEKIYHNIETGVIDVSNEVGVSKSFHAQSNGVKVGQSDAVKGLQAPNTGAGQSQGGCC